MRRRILSLGRQLSSESAAASAKKVTTSISKEGIALVSLNRPDKVTYRHDITYLIESKIYK